MGITCPECGCEKIRVVDTMPDTGRRIFRRRKCTGCGFTFRTIEVICTKQHTLEKSKNKLVPVKELPAKEYNRRHDNAVLCEEFMRMNVKYAKVDLCIDEYRAINYAYSSLRQSVLDKNYPFYVVIRNGDIYFVRTDMEEKQ